MSIYLLRHEQRDPTDPLFYSPLTAGGKLNAEAIKGQLGTLNIDSIYSSPFLRAIQTIYPYCIETGKQVFVDNSLYESLDNPLFTNANSSFGWQDLPLPFRSVVSHDYETLCKGVALRESFDEIRLRVRPFLQRIRNMHKTENVLLVTHMTTAKALVAEATGNNEAASLGMGQIMRLL